MFNNVYTGECDSETIKECSLACTFVAVVLTPMQDWRVESRLFEAQIQFTLLKVESRDLLRHMCRWGCARWSRNSRTGYGRWNTAAEKVMAVEKLGLSREENECPKPEKPDRVRTFARSFADKCVKHKICDVGKALAWRSVIRFRTVQLNHVRKLQPVIQPHPQHLSHPCSRSLKLKDCTFHWESQRLKSASAATRYNQTHL